MITEYSNKNNNNQSINTRNQKNKLISHYSLTTKKNKKHKNIIRNNTKINFNNNLTERKSTLPPIRTDQQILKEIESRKPKNIGSIFLFDKQPQKRKKIQSLNYINEIEKYDIKKIKNFNVFSTEDNEIKDLMFQFDKNSKNKLMPKNKRKRKIRFRKL